MSFVKRELTITFTGKTTVVAEGLRATARIVKAGSISGSTAQIAIWGLSLSHMNELATFGTQIHPQYDYVVKVEAGDAENGMSVVFTGNIIQAWANFQSAPDVPFNVIAYSNGKAQVQDGKVNSYSGPTDVDGMLKTLAGQAGLQYKSAGIKFKLDSPYHWGSPMNQIKSIADSLNIGWIIDNNTLVCWTPSTAVDGELLISPQTGMVSYPTFTTYGVLAKIEFKRSIQFGSSMTVQSDLTPANGKWFIRKIDYDLAAKVPKGPWFASLGGMKDASGVTL